MLNTVGMGMKVLLSYLRMFYSGTNTHKCSEDKITQAFLLDNNWIQWKLVSSASQIFIIRKSVRNVIRV